MKRAKVLIAAGKCRHEKIRLSETETENAFESIYVTIEQLSIEQVKKWKLAPKGKDNGMHFVFAAKDR